MLFIWNNAYSKNLKRSGIMSRVKLTSLEIKRKIANDNTLPLAIIPIRQDAYEFIKREGNN